jgi:F-type H+-transporting ATPase subunit a
MSDGAMDFDSIKWHFPQLPHLPPDLTLLYFSWIVWAIIIVGSIVVARGAIKRLRHNDPGRVGGLQAVLEMFFEFICTMADEIIGPEAKKFYPLFIGLFIFILVGNLIGFIPGLVSPTSDPNLTFGLAVMVFLYFVFLGFKYNGIGYLKQFAGPKLEWYMFPVSVLLTITEVISFFTRPLSLGLRLFCNIFSKELFLSILALLMLNFFKSSLPLDKFLTLMPLVLRPFIMMLGLIIAFIQALVFMVLSMSYIAGAVHMEEH